MRMDRTWIAALSFVCLSADISAQEVILPQNRAAYFSSEGIELAVAGRGKEAVVVELVPQQPGATRVKFSVAPDGLTATYALAPQALAPNVYAIKLNGKDAGKLTITTGVPRSSMLVSQSSTRPPEGGANFILGNAFSFGLLDGKGQALIDVRGKRSGGLSFFEEAVLRDLPVIVYMYWTGYVVHKPFGDEKSWASPSMNEAMRLLSFHTAQRLRRYGKAIESLGPIDEPGLAWGKTPAGGMASGFPSWDEADWYGKRGWKFTDDPTRRPDADWMKYLTLRCAIIKENYAQARQDVRSVWPEVTWSGDLYAPHAIMDGTDPLSQDVNDVPASHVFFDFFGGPMAVPGQMYLEKANNPLAPLAHAMNGQLTGTQHKNQRTLFHLLMNNMFQGGLASNWWLNTGGMTKEDLAAVNGPAERLGPVFRAMTPRDHDLALLWSFTEIGMREKESTAREAQKKAGEQIKLLLPLPEAGEKKQFEINTSPYEVGATYTHQVLGLHQALRRAGFAAHILHERRLPRDLARYRTLIVVGQTHEFPADVRKALTAFTKAGGKIVRDRSTSVKLPGAVVVGVPFSAADVRAREALAAAKAKAAASKLEASLYSTSWHYTKPHRAAVTALKAALAQTESRPVFVSDDVDLGGERHAAGEGALVMVVNGHESEPVASDKESYYTYNFAPHKTSFTLRGVPKGSAVYAIEGLDWDAVSPLPQPEAPVTTAFAGGEMKLYLIAPRAPAGLRLGAEARGGRLQVKAALDGVRMPWPFTLTVTAPDGRELYKLYRATWADGKFEEDLPIGANAEAGTYVVRAVSPVAGLSAEAKADHRPQAEPKALAAAVRVFDEAAVRALLKTKPALTIALGKPEQKALADELAAGLGARGIKAVVRPENEVLRKVAYPRVWDPYARLYKPTGAEQKPGGEVKQEIVLTTSPSGELSAKTADGKSVENWRMPSSLVTVAGDGFLDWSGGHELAYEPGCKLYIDPKGQLTVLKGELSWAKTTDDFRARWARPWSRLTQHVGGFQLPATLPEAYTADGHLILLGDSTSGTAVAALQASEILPQIADAKYPGPGKALLSYAWSPFAVDKDVILIGAGDVDGLRAGVQRLLELTPR
jgi:hypothetical protein